MEVSLICLSNNSLNISLMPLFWGAWNVWPPQAHYTSFTSLQGWSFGSVYDFIPFVEGGNWGIKTLGSKGWLGTLSVSASRLGIEWRNLSLWGSSHWATLEEWGSDGREEVGWVKEEWCWKIRRIFCCNLLVAGKTNIFWVLGRYLEGWLGGCWRKVKFNLSVLTWCCGKDREGQNN